MRCIQICDKVQTLNIWDLAGTGSRTTVDVSGNRVIKDSDCALCGQCITHCPTGGLRERDDTAKARAALADKEKITVVQVAPAVRTAWGEYFGLKREEATMERMAGALHRLGFDYVYDTNFAADLTIIEEGNEFLHRLKSGALVRWPMFTSCCPGWVRFLKGQYPELTNQLSTAKSPQQMFGAIAKNYWAEKMNIPRQNLVVVSIMPCLAKKYECSREEFSSQGDPDVNYSLSTRELASLIKRANIDFNSLADEDFDHPLGESTGAGVIFGASGGVMEAALRTAYELYTGKTLDKVDFKEVRGLENIKKATIKLNGVELHVGIAHGLGNARKLLNEIREGKSEFHAIEIMACPGGCIGGGGQPLHHGNSALLKARSQAIYQEDEHKPLRKSHENPDIIKLYEEYLGKPLSEKAHHLLHTHYFNKATIN